MGYDDEYIYHLIGATEEEIRRYNPEYQTRHCERCQAKKVEVHRHHVGITGMYYVRAGVTTEKEYEAGFVDARILCWMCHEDITQINLKFRKIFWGHLHRRVFDRRNTPSEFKELAKAETRLFNFFVQTLKNEFKRHEVLRQFLEKEDAQARLNSSEKECLGKITFTDETLVVLPGMC